MLPRKWYKGQATDHQVTVRDALLVNRKQLEIRQAHAGLRRITNQWTFGRSPRALWWWEIWRTGSSPTPSALQQHCRNCLCPGLNTDKNEVTVSEHFMVVSLSEVHGGSNDIFWTEASPRGSDWGRTEVGWEDHPTVTEGTARCGWASLLLSVPPPHSEYW